MGDSFGVATPPFDPQQFWKSLALDINRDTDLCRGDASVVATVELADAVWLPFIVLGELRAGFAVGSQGPRNEAVLRRFC